MAALVGSPVTGQGDGTGSSIAASAASHTTGNCLTVEVKFENAGGNVTSITDTALNVYTIHSQGSHSTETRLRTAIASCENITGNASNVVTANLSSGTSEWRRIIVKEWSGVASAGALDDSDSGEGTGTTYSTPALTTTRSGVVVAGVGAFAGLSGITAGGTPTFTQSGAVSDTFSSHLISASAQSVTPGASSSTSADWVMRAIALKDVAVPPTFGQRQDMHLHDGGIGTRQLLNVLGWF